MKRMFLGGLAACGFVLGTAAPANADEPAPLEPDPSEAAPAPAPMPSPPPDEAPRPPPKKVGPAVAIFAEGGYAARTIEALPSSGGSGGLGIDLQLTRGVSTWVEPTVFLGSTENGLRVRSATMGVGLDLLPHERVRLGLGVHTFWLGVQRVTHNHTIPTWGGLASAGARFDVVQGDTFALFVRAAIEAGMEIHDSALLWGPTLSAGFAFDVGTAKRSELK